VFTRSTRRGARRTLCASEQLARARDLGAADGRVPFEEPPYLLSILCLDRLGPINSFNPVNRTREALPCDVLLNRWE
jgi:hypothetical protein